MAYSALSVGAVAAKRSARQLDEIAGFVKWLYTRSGAATWAEFADLAGVHQVSLSQWHNAKACPDGYNLLRLIRAAGVLDDASLTRGPTDRARELEALATVERIRRLLGPGQEESPQSGQGSA